MHLFIRIVNKAYKIVNNMQIYEVSKRWSFYYTSIFDYFLACLWFELTSNTSTTIINVITLIYAIAEDDR